MVSPVSSIVQEETSSPSLTLDTLVSHLLAAKRSLSCVKDVSQANFLVTTTRQALESHAIISARTQFLQIGSKAQAQVLEQVQQHTHSITQEIAAEFSEVIRNLDKADTRLRNTVDRLKQTIVEPSLRPSGEGTKTLLDFVDETGVQALMSTIKESIDVSGEARKEFEEIIRSLEDEIGQATELLSSHHHKGSSTGSFQDDPRSPVPEALARMEEMAQEMAGNLESLVRHFDLCMTAIKHTEGGAAAATSKITSDLPEEVRLQFSSDEADDAPLSPISDSERKEMLAVLQKDATEVDDVVLEIRDRLSEMESDFSLVNDHGALLASIFNATSSALLLLEDIGTKLPQYITQSQIFLFRWDEEKAKIEQNMAELESLREFYAGFLLAYDNLIIEVGRRKDTEKRVTKIRQDALGKIERLLAEEVAERSAFRKAQGDFLPVDIWPGLMVGPPRWDVVVVEGAADSVPDISASVITRAIRRLDGGGMETGGSASGSSGGDGGGGNGNGGQHQQPQHAQKGSAGSSEVVESQ